VREAALREGPAASADRVPVLLDEVETVVFGRDDQGEVVSLDDGVRAAGSVAALNVVLAEPDPGVGIDDAAAERPDFGVGLAIRFRMHRIILPSPADHTVAAPLLAASAPRAPAGGRVINAGSW
jgi:hypothetical protein